MRSFIEPNLFDHNVLFDNTTPIYLINLPWKLGLGLELDLKMHYSRWTTSVSGCEGSGDGVSRGATGPTWKSRRLMTFKDQHATMWRIDRLATVRRHYSLRRGSRCPHCGWSARHFRFVRWCDESTGATEAKTNPTRRRVTDGIRVNDYNP